MLGPNREKRRGPLGSSMTTMVGTPPACRLRTAPKPTASELRTTAQEPKATAQGDLRSMRPTPGEGLIRLGFPDGARVTIRAAIHDEACHSAGRVPRPHDKATEWAE